MLIKRYDFQIIKVLKFSEQIVEMNSDITFKDNLSSGIQIVLWGSTDITKKIEW